MENLIIITLGILFILALVVAFMYYLKLKALRVDLEKSEIKAVESFSHQEIVHLVDMYQKMKEVNQLSSFPNFAQWFKQRYQSEEIPNEICKLLYMNTKLPKSFEAQCKDYYVIPKSIVEFVNPRTKDLFTRSVRKMIHQTEDWTKDRGDYVVKYRDPKTKRFAADVFKKPIKEAAGLS